jgi:hypothetical protein
MENTKCFFCGLKFTKKNYHDILGFQANKCERCRYISHLPLNNYYKYAYYFGIVLFFIAIIITLNNIGTHNWELEFFIFIASLFGIISIGILNENRKIKKTIKNNQYNQLTEQGFSDNKDTMSFKINDEHYSIDIRNSKLIKKCNSWDILSFTKEIFEYKINDNDIYIRTIEYDHADGLDKTYYIINGTIVQSMIENNWKKTSLFHYFKNMQDEISFFQKKTTWEKIDNFYIILFIMINNIPQFSERTIRNFAESTINNIVNCTNQMLGLGEKLNCILIENKDGFLIQKNDGIASKNECEKNFQAELQKLNLTYINIQNSKMAIRIITSLAANRGINIHAMPLIVPM